jgi:hypothetical protein
MSFFMDLDVPFYCGHLNVDVLTDEAKGIALICLCVFVFASVHMHALCVGQMDVTLQ